MSAQGAKFKYLSNDMVSLKMLLITLHKALLLNRKIAHTGTGYGSLFGSIPGNKSLPSQR